MNPSISVIISTYSSEAFIAECLSDITNQTIFDSIEIVIVDASSPEREKEIIEQFQLIYGNIRYFRTSERIGIYAAWNIAIRHTAGKYILPFSTNDRLAPYACEVLMTALNDNPDVMLVYGDSWLTPFPHQTFEDHMRSGEFLWPDHSFEFMLENCCIGPHPMWRKSVHDYVGFFDERYIAVGDQEMWLRMGERFPMLHIPFVTGLCWHSTDGLCNRQENSMPELMNIFWTYQQRHKKRKARISAIEEQKNEAALNTRFKTGNKRIRPIPFLPENRIPAAEYTFRDEADEFQTSAAVYARMLSLNPCNALAHNNLGIICCIRGDIASACHHHEQAVLFEPDNTVFLKNLADLYYTKLDRADDAMEIYSGLRHTYPNDPEVLAALQIISPQFLH